jgi:hypothetical protein
MAAVIACAEFMNRLYADPGVAMAAIADSQVTV